MMSFRRRPEFEKPPPDRCRRRYCRGAEDSRARRGSSARARPCFARRHVAIKPSASLARSLLLNR